MPLVGRASPSWEPLDLNYLVLREEDVKIQREDLAVQDLTGQQCQNQAPNSYFPTLVWFLSMFFPHSVSFFKFCCFYYFNHILKHRHSLHLKIMLWFFNLWIIILYRETLWAGGDGDDQSSHGQKSRGLTAFGCFWFQVRHQNAWYPPLSLPQHNFLRFARPDNLTQLFWEFRWKSASSFSFNCVYLAILMEANGEVEKCLNLCDYSHSSVLRNPWRCSAR